jgi:hypothetical protein
MEMGFEIPSYSSPSTPIPTPSPVLTQPLAPATKRSKVPLWIVHREPRHLEEHWREGQMKDKSLATFIKDLSNATQRTRIEEIKLELRTLNGDIRCTVKKDEEKEWSDAKASFREKLAEGGIRSNKSSQEEKILVEPVYGGILVRAGSDDEEEIVF